MLHAEYFYSLQGRGSDGSLKIDIEYRNSPFSIQCICLSVSEYFESEILFDSPDLARVCMDINSFLNGRLSLLPLEYLDLAGQSEFSKKVFCALRNNIPRGSTVSYAQLAKFAGFPEAARAVGTAMRKNRFPLFFPCHRVIKSDGTLGNYQGSSNGSALKKILLDIETNSTALFYSLPVGET